MKTINRTFVFFLISVLLSGCASFQGGQIKPVKEFSDKETKPKTKAFIEFKQNINGRTRSPEKLKNKLYGRMISSFNQTGVFGEVSKLIKNPDLTVEVTFQNKGNFSQAGAFLTGATFFLIPTKATDRFILDATITNKNGEKWSVHLEEHMDSWLHITLLPITPFKFPTTVARNIHHKMFENLVKEMEQKKILDSV